MNLRLPKLPTISVPRIAFLERLLAHVRTLSPGDKLIAGALTALVAILALCGIYTLERTFLVEVPSNGGNLVEGALGSPRFVNPLLALSDTDRDLVALTYAGLMGRSADGTLIPVLAESYDISEDGKTYTFRLREHARFSDGSPVTAEDIAFTVRKAQDPGLKSPRLSDWANIQVETLDARTVAFTLPKAYGFFLEDATLGILPAHIWRDVSNEEFPFSPYMTSPVGAGPFKPGDVKRDKDGVIEEYELTASERYPLGRPYLDTITFIFFAQEEDLVRAYESGRVESAYGVPDPEALRAPYSRIFGVFFNHNQNPLFARAEVRRALSLAIDREGISEEVLGGYATPLWGPVPPGSAIAAFVPERVEENPTAEAARVLEAAGWEYNEETRIWRHAGDELELSVTVKTSNVAELRAIAEQISSDWNKLGVPVSLEFYEPGDLAQNVIRPRRYEALLFGMVVGRDRDLFAFWHSSERNDPGLNIAMYTNSTVDDLLEDVRTASDPATVAEDLAKIDELVGKEYPAAFTHAPDFLYAVPKDLRGIEFTQVASPSDRFQGASSWYRHTEFVWPVFASSRVKSQQ